jgi:hypothetical protein
LSAEKSITVRVRRNDGQPAGRAIVSVPRSTTPFPELALVADLNGVVRLSLPSGHYTIEAFTDGGERGSADIAVENGGHTTIKVQVTGG